jgi:tRNA(fMet)-specific endonuclease VapC
MTRYLLDTNHLSPLITPGHSLRERVQRQFASGDTFAIPSPVLSEFLFGIGGLPRVQQNRQEWQHIRSDFGFIDINAELAEEAANLRLILQKRGWQIKLFDALIAVVALRDNFILLTTDKDFHGIDGLRHENWRTA